MSEYNRRGRKHFKRNNAHFGSRSNFMNLPVQLAQSNTFQMRFPRNALKFKKPEWKIEDAEKAIQTEINICKNRKSIVMTLPDLPVCTEDIYRIDPAIRYVKFEKNLTPRPCYVNYKSVEAIDKITTELKKLKFNNKSPTIEVQSSDGPVDQKCLNNIDPYVLYVSNIEDLASNYRMLSDKYAPGVITISGREEWNKKTYFVNILFPSVDLAIEAMQRNFRDHFKFNNRRLKVRFLRSNHKISNKNALNQSSTVSPRKRSCSNISSDTTITVNSANSEHDFALPHPIKQEVSCHNYPEEEVTSFADQIKVEPLDY